MSIASPTQIESALNLLRSQGIARSKDLTAHGISRCTIAKLVESGKVERVSRGLYALAESDLGEHASLLAIAKRVPQGVVCLLSALRFHEIGTQSPSEVWVAIDHKAQQPRIEYPPVHLVRFSGEAMSGGVEDRVLNGVNLRVYGIAKTLADCFKYRHKIGLDIAIEALQEARRSRRVNLEELWHYAKICRVANVIRPYLEAIG